MQNYDPGGKDEVLLSEKRSVSFAVAKQNDETQESQCLAILLHSDQEAQLLNSQKIYLLECIKMLHTDK